MFHPFLYFPASPFAGDKEKVFNTYRFTVLTITVFLVALWNTLFSSEQRLIFWVAGNIFFGLTSLLRVSTPHKIYRARRGLYQQSGMCK